MENKINFRNTAETEEFIKNMFSDSPERLRHILKVAEQVRDSASTLGLDASLAYCAALVHDIGYLPELVHTGFHPIDGATYLTECGFPDIAELIICHSNSPEQAKLKGLPEIPISNDPIARLITFWDVQTKQGGEVVSYDERLADIVARYGKDSDVTKAHRMAEARIRSILEEFQQKF